MVGEVLEEGVLVELVQILEGGLQRLMTLVPAIANGQGQPQVLVVQLSKLLLADHDLLFVRVGVAADVEVFGL